LTTEVVLFLHSSTLSTIGLLFLTLKKEAEHLSKNLHISSRMGVVTIQKAISFNLSLVLLV
jgi:hypothetical protein